MKKNRRVISLLAILVMLFAFSCGDEEKETVYIRIFSYGSAFSGWYVMNGESPEFFKYSSKEDGEIFYHELVLEDLDEVEVEVASDDPVSSMAIRIYQDDEKVKEVSQESSYDDEYIRLNISYTYGESDDGDEDE